MKKELFIISVLWSPSNGRYYLIQRKDNNGWSFIGNRVKYDTNLTDIEEIAKESIGQKTGYTYIEYKGEIDRIDQDGSALF